MRKTNEGKNKYTCVAIRHSRVHRWTKLSVHFTDDGRQKKPFFIRILGQIDWGIKFCDTWNIFGQTFLQKLKLNIHIPNIFLSLGFDFGPQRIRDLAFVRSPWSAL